MSILEFVINLENEIPFSANFLADDDSILYDFEKVVNWIECDTPNIGELSDDELDDHIKDIEESCREGYVMKQSKFEDYALLKWTEFKRVNNLEL